MLPTVSSILLAQNLYDVLFQYVVTEEKEEKLKTFIDLLETHIKSKNQAPFSMPLSQLDFLEEGLQELKLLNWYEVPVTVFRITIDDCLNKEDYDQQLEEAINLLEDLMTISRQKDSDIIWAYPANLVR